MKPNLTEMPAERHQAQNNTTSIRIMKCPICPETDLVMTERQGVEIDYCPKCRDIWLDRGELDKIIERSMSASPEPQLHRAPMPDYHGHEREHSKHDSNHHGHDSHYGRRRSWLRDLFD